MNAHYRHAGAVYAPAFAPRKRRLCFMPGAV
jgi:hypothetical protein